MATGDITFVSFDRTRHKLLSTAHMRQTEQDAIASGMVTGLSMMETAGSGVVNALLQADPDYATGDHHALVICGPGNNGGDGFVIARVLQKRGWTVDVGLYGEIDKLPADAAENAQRWLKTGAIIPLMELSDAQITKADVAFDALFGTGLLRPINAELFRLLERVAHKVETIVAVDIPTGISSDTGNTLCEIPTDAPLDVAHDWRFPSWPRADHVVTFQRLKSGHVLAASKTPSERPAALGTKTLSIVDLGIEAFEPPGENNNAVFLGGTPLNLLKDNRGHKYEHGHTLVFAGGAGKGGAGRLAAQAALRIGAGAVTLACPSGAMTENAAQLNAVMLTPVDTSADLQQLLHDKRKNALCLGPGMGADEHTKSLVLTALQSGRPTVLDADALTCFGNDTKELFSRTHEKVVLTPHEGEFSTLFPDLSATLNTNSSDTSRIDIVRHAAKRANCHVLLKGPVTIIANASGHVELSVALADRTAPWLATAGAGDVLAGFISGLLARGFEPFHAATAAAWLHVECARTFGPGLIAEDLPDMLPRVLRQWEQDLKAGKFAP